MVNFQPPARLTKYAEASSPRAVVGCAAACQHGARESRQGEEHAAKLFQKKLNNDQQVLHALDRLTFGPRPGDFAQVKKMGLKKWIDLQLHPERIAENAELKRKLEPLESLRMTPLETVQHYPTPQMIRAIAQGQAADAGRSAAARER